MAVVEVVCRYGKETDQVYRHGKGHAGQPRFRCVDCNKRFQIHDAYEAHQPGAKARIIDMALSMVLASETPLGF